MTPGAPTITYRQLALEECKGKPAPIRWLALLAAGQMDDGGPLLQRLRATPVPGREGRERGAKAAWLRKVCSLLIKWIAHMDTVSEDVGRGHDRTFYGLRVGPKKVPDGKSLAEWLDEHTDESEAQRTCERVVEALSKGGYVKNWGRSKVVDGKHVGMCSVRKITVDAILPAGELTKWRRTQDEESAARKAKAIEEQRTAQLSPEVRARISLSEAAAHNAGRRPIGQGRSEFTSGADLAARMLARAGPPKPSSA